jgi:hypothetical protein
LRGIGAAGVEPACTFTLSAGYKPEGIRPGWRPGSWTLRYGFIRAASSPAESPPAEGGSVDLPGMTPRGLSRPVAAPAAHLPWISTEERGGIEPQRLIRPAAFGAAPATLAGSLSGKHNCSPARCEQAGDGRGRRSRISPRRATRFPTGASHLAGSSSEEGGRLERHEVTRASASNGARPLAGSPSMSTVPGIRTPITGRLRPVSLPLD